MNRTNADQGPLEEPSQPTGQQTGRPENIAEMDITGPVLTWLEISHPQQPVPVGENDEVLDSRYNEDYDVWEVLLMALPDDTEGGESEEAEE